MVFMIRLLASSAMLAGEENMTVCGPLLPTCSGDCKTYSVPLDHCFAPPKLFPGDPQWGNENILDHCNATHLSRSFFAEDDTACSRRTDGFVVPVNECIGPFGVPRPWGIFTCSP